MHEWACSVLERWSRCSPGTSLVGQGIVTSCGCCGAPSWGVRKQGAIFCCQLAGNHARSAETPLVRLTPPWGRSCGWVVTVTFTGPLGARLRSWPFRSRSWCSWPQTGQVHPLDTNSHNMALLSRQQAAQNWHEAGCSLQWPAECAGTI